MLCTYLGHRLANCLMRQHRGPLLGEFDEQDFFGLAPWLSALKCIKQSPQLRRNETCQYPEGAVDLLEEFYVAAESGQNRKFANGWLQGRAVLRKEEKSKGCEI
jgi:hypothetical protein